MNVPPANSSLQLCAFEKYDSESQKKDGRDFCCRAKVTALERKVCRKKLLSPRLATQSGEVFPPGALPSNTMIVDSVASLHPFFVLFSRQNDSRII